MTNPFKKLTSDGFLFVLRGECELRVFDAHAMQLERQLNGAEAQEAFASAQINCIDEKVAQSSVISLQEIHYNSTNECHNCTAKVVKGLLIHCDIETIIQGIVVNHFDRMFFLVSALVWSF